MSNKFRLLTSTTLLLAATLATSAHAQSKQATTAAAAAAAASNTIEELVVTAEKRAQSLQDVPVAISAFSSERRDLVGINTIQDMTNFTPGLNYTSANDRATIRGVGRLTNAHPVPVPVAVYDDGIYTTSTVTAGKTPIFTDRVEVLRGPQGTLYGRNSMGGAINVISKRPTEDFYAEARAAVANYGHTTVELAVSGPITQGLQFRLAGNWDKQRDGYFTNIVPGMHSEGGVVDTFYLEGQLQAKFGDHLDGWAKLFISGWNNGSGGPGARAGYGGGPFGFGEFGGQNVNAGFACAPGGVVTNVVNTSPLGCVNPASLDPRKFASNFNQNVALDDTYGLATNLTYHGDGYDLKYIGGGLNYHYSLESDLGGGSIVSFTIPIRPLATVTTPGPTFGNPVQGTCSATFVAIGVCTPLTIRPKFISTYQEDYHNFSHELDIASTGNGPVQWVGGLYYYKEGYRQPVFTTQPEQSQLDNAVTAAVPALTGPVGLDFQRRLYDDRPQFEQESYAAFGQVDWKITDQWKLTLGLRWNHDGLSGTEAVRVMCFATTACGTTPESLGSFTPPVDVTAAVVYTGDGVNNTPQGVVKNGTLGGVTFTPDGFAHRNYDASWEATTGTAGIQWDPEPGTMMYARYGRGYLMGGFASGVTSTLGKFPYTNSEHVDDFELGLKKDFGHRFQLDVDLFYEKLKGYQAPLTVVNNTGALAVSESRFLNIPESTIKGIEVEGTWIPFDNLTLLFTYDYNDGQITKLSGIIDPTDPQAVSAGAKPLASSGPVVACSAAPTQPCDANTGLVSRAQDLSGNQLPQSPKTKVAVNATYSWRTDMGTLSPSVSYIWRDKQYSNIFTRALGAAPSWDQWDARITWKQKDNKYSIIAYVKNIGDTLGYDGGAGAGRTTGSYAQSTITAAGLTKGNPSNGASCYNTTVTTLNCNYNAVQGFTTSYALTPPRTYGVEFQYRF